MSSPFPFRSFTRSDHPAVAALPPLERTPRKFLARQSGTVLVKRPIEIGPGQADIGQQMVVEVGQRRHRPPVVPIPQGAAKKEPMPATVAPELEKPG